MSTIIPFGVLPGGEEVSLIRLKGNGAVQAEIITLGAIIKSLWVPDCKDDRKDVVLGQDSLEAYLNNQSCSAAVIGRVANRIGGASFSIVKEKYQLPMIVAIVSTVAAEITLHRIFRWRRSGKTGYACLWRTLERADFPAWYG